MEAIRELTQLKEMAHCKLLQAASRIQPLGLTRFLATPRAAITRRLVSAHSVAIRRAVITRLTVLPLSFLIRLALTIPQLVLKCYLPTPPASRMRLLVRERSSQTPRVSITRLMVF